MTRRFQPRVGATARTDPARHSPQTSQNRRRSFGYAISGCVYMLRYQKNTRIQLLFTVAVVAAGLWLGIEADQWAVLTLAIGVVWLAEFFNAAIEAAVNLSTAELHPMAKVAKDVAAAAVLLAACVAGVAGALILGSAMLQRL